MYVSFFVYRNNDCFSPFARINAFVKNCIKQFGHEKNHFLSTRLQHFGKYVIKTTNFSGFEICNSFLYFICSYFCVQKVTSIYCYVVILIIRLIGSCADNVAILTTTPCGLQHQLESLKVCCDRLKMEVTTDKTKFYLSEKAITHQSMKNGFMMALKWKQ